MIDVSPLLALLAPRAPLLALVLARIAGLLLIAPVLGAAAIPTRIRAALAFAIALPIIGRIEASGARVELEGLLLVAALGLEVAIGLAIGLVAQLVVTAARLAGELAGTQMGFGLATLTDPQMHTQTTPLAEWQSLTAMFLFLALDVHLTLLGALSESFQTVPVGGGAGSTAVVPVIVGLAAGIFSSALRIASPVIVVLLLVNAAMGVLSRLIPQLNALAMGFTVNIGAGLLILTASEAWVVRHLAHEFEALPDRLAMVVRAF